MTILAIDTSTDYLSLAILKSGRVAAKFHKKADRKHSMLLVPMVDRLLKKAGLKIREIDCFAISVGPGSFTGLRIGVTVVKGLAYALKKKIVAVPTLDVIADNAKSFKGVICPVLDARKNKVYACLYKSDGKRIKRTSKYLLLPVEDLLKKVKAMRHNPLFLGDAIGLIFAGPAKISIKDWHPKAEIVAMLGAEYCRKKKFVKAEDLEPLYLYSHECDITGK
ncbi:MAG: tRNA (adenosine(37)-N6)-threonylcarbamoyltransferase complex dimerization subunit type 1 TsaB [Candidatus Omnitrophota bacterium]|nr:tRNA (adenosine(37)-N6)-threonylcarbamoyltransferase complex dimerization subunit type 1 TsaB [Candidatus Omnitrophota bacterium]